MKKKDELPECPVALTVSLIGGKWKLLILRDLLERSWRFNELQRDLSGISAKILTESLRQMENDGIVTRKDYNSMPLKVEYSLSSLGQSMKPVIKAMEDWGKAYKNSL